MDFKTKPFAHQLDCFKKLIDEPYQALLLDPGLGKTKIIIDLIQYRKEQYGYYPTLVVCPNTLVMNWHAEIEKHSYLTSVPVLGTRKKRIKLLKEQADVHIINYESSWRLVNELLSCGYGCVVFDESQALKTHNSSQSKGAFELSKHIENRYILTGTVLMNNPLDAFAQYRCLDPSIYGYSYYRFKYRYAIWGGFGNYQVKKWVHMTEFKKKLHSCAIRLTKEDCLDLPEKLYQIHQFELPKEQRKAYKELKDNFIASLGQTVATASIVLTRLIRFSQITAGFIKDIEGEEIMFSKNPKLDWLIDFVEESKDGTHILVFTRFKKEVSMISDKIKDRDVEVFTLVGGVKDPVAVVDAFNSSKNKSVLIANTKVAKEGLNITSASYCVFMTNDYSYGARFQAENRVHRIGQSKNVTIIDLVYTGTVDESIAKTLGKKKSLSDMIVDDLVKLI